MVRIYLRATAGEQRTTIVSGRSQVIAACVGQGPGLEDAVGGCRTRRRSASRI